MVKMNKCSEECKYYQQFNDDWCICWHPNYRGSKKLIKLPCLLELDPIKGGDDK